jgi:hypothetical protein
VKPGTTAVEDIEETNTAHNSTAKTECAAFIHTELDRTRMTYNPEAIVVAPKYAIVGFRLNGAKCLLQPVFATWDPETCTTSWTGTGGDIWLAAYGETTRVHFPDRGIQISDPDTAGRQPGMMRGVQLAWDEESTVSIRYASTSSCCETGLPFDFPETEGITYEPISL